MTMIVSRSRTLHPLLAPLTLDGTVLKESADLAILWEYSVVMCRAWLGTLVT